MIFQCDVAPVQPRDVGVGVGISRLHLRVDIRLLPVDVPPHHVWIRGEPGQTIGDCQSVICRVRAPPVGATCWAGE